jgi:hypothetical protein
LCDVSDYWLSGENESKSRINFQTFSSYEWEEAEEGTG